MGRHASHQHLQSKCFFFGPIISSVVALHTDLANPCPARLWRAANSRSLIVCPAMFFVVCLAVSLIYWRWSLPLLSEMQSVRRPLSRSRRSFARLGTRAVTILVFSRRLASRIALAASICVHTIDEIHKRHKHDEMHHTFPILFSCFFSALHGFDAQNSTHTRTKPKQTG